MENHKEKVIGILVGNKSDLKEDESVSEEAKVMAHEFGLEYIESSCKSGYNLDEIFNLLTEKILENSPSLLEDNQGEQIRLN